MSRRRGALLLLLLLLLLAVGSPGVSGDAAATGLTAQVYANSAMRGTSSKRFVPYYVAVCWGPRTGLPHIELGEPGVPGGIPMLWVTTGYILVLRVPLYRHIGYSFGTQSTQASSQRSYQGLRAA